MKHTLLFLSLCALAAAPAAASSSSGFSRLDTDADGAVTWEEFSAALPNMKRAAFDTIDADRNGAVSPDEWQVFAADHGRHQKDRPAPPAAADNDVPLIEPPGK